VTTLRPLRYVEVTWDDAHGGNAADEDAGWMSLDALMNNVTGPLRIVTVGQLVKDDDDGLVVVSSINTSNGSVGEYTYIPRACVTTCFTLRRS